jgi:lipid II:glycine glycyltransferase (peptidoglycan interpeptide bridge formation enzyme)
LDTLEFGDLEQTQEYGEAKKRAYPGSEVVRLLALEKECPVGLIQGLYQRRLGYGRDLVVGGPCGCSPVTMLEDRKEEVIRFLLEGLEDFAVKNRIIEAYVHWPRQWGFSYIFDDLKYEVRHSFNVYTVSLKGSPRDLWNRIHSNKRRNVKKAELAGVTVEDSESEHDFESLLGMLKASSLRADFDPRVSEVEELWKEFSSKGSARVFLAKWNGHEVAGTLIVAHGDTAYARTAGSFKDAWEVRPNDILHWKSMEWACEHGYSWYHMGAVPEPEPSEGSPLWGLWRWKREWRGMLQGISVYSKVYFPTVRRVMDATRRARHTIGKLSR